jgi:hypothetical protein
MLLYRSETNSEATIKTTSGPNQETRSIRRERTKKLKEVMMIVGFGNRRDLSWIYNVETEEFRGLLRTNVRQPCKACASLTPFVSTGVLLSFYTF